MIAHLSGLVFRKTTQSVIIDVNGIGYEVIVPLSTFYNLPDEAGRADLHIHTHVREDTLALFGFHTRLEKDIFLMLISVSGIGPKLAINILSGIGPQELLEAIAHGNSVRLQAIPGVGKKTAERMALELKDRALKVFGQEELLAPDIPEGEDKRRIDDALSALLNLGYSPKFAKPALEKARTSTKEMTLEGLIREALRLLA
ncbi:MAG: Holliday junction branch migration protein RuvA [Deltaproteobacteria bacterium]|nr:Holliday junction branch migration protein RuvA [Deltaproteobacteria bacterium]